MKKLLSIAVAAMAAVALADDPVVTGTPSTEIGVTKITTTKQNTIVAVPYTSLANKGESIEAIRLVKVKGLPEGTQLFQFVNGAYKAWSISEGNWAPMTSVGTSGIVAGNIDTKLAKGTAIWVVLPEKPEQSQSQAIYLYGAYEPEVTTPIVAGMNLVANPMQDAAEFTFDKIAKGDTITMTDDANATVYTYTDLGWQHTEKQGTGLPKKVLELPPIAPGCGFWYNAQVAGTMTWDYIN